MILNRVKPRIVLIEIVLTEDPLYKLLTLIQPGKGRFTLAYMSHDYLHGSHAGLPGLIRVKTLN